VLSSLLADLRLADPVWGIIELSRSGAVRFSAGRGVYFHMVLSGSFLLKLTGLSAPLKLVEGAMIFVIAADRHSLLTEATSRTTEIKYFDIAGRTDRIGMIRVGEGSGDTLSTCLTGTFHLDPVVIARLRKLLPGAGCGKALLLPLAEDAYIPAPRVAHQAAGRGGAVVLTRLADLMIVLAARRQLISGESLVLAATLSNDLPSAVLEGVRLMRNSPSYQWTVASLAESVRMSRSSFAAAFSVGVGEPPMAYLTRVRMERALELVVGTDLPLVKICDSSGLSSIPSFSRLFKGWHGASPRHYRMKSKTKADEGAFRPGDHWAMFA
jgi:AraC-like DNA-binding protein